MTAYRIEISSDLSDGALPLYILRHAAESDAEAYASAMTIVHGLDDPRMKGWRLVISRPGPRLYRPRRPRRAISPEAHSGALKRACR